VNGLNLIGFPDGPGHSAPVRGHAQRHLRQIRFLCRNRHGSGRHGLRAAPAIVGNAYTIYGTLLLAWFIGVGLKLFRESRA